MEKHNKISSKMYKHLVQQNLHNNCVTLLINQFVFTKLVEFPYQYLKGTVMQIKKTVINDLLHVWKVS